MCCRKVGVIVSKTKSLVNFRVGFRCWWFGLHVKLEIRKLVAISSHKSKKCGCIAAGPFHMFHYWSVIAERRMLSAEDFCHASR